MDALKQYIKIFLSKTFSQQDPAWRNETLGSKGTIGAYGCLETDATMVANYYGANETPATMNQKLKDNGGFSDGSNIGKGNLLVWGAIASIFGLKYSGKFSNDNLLTKANMDQIRGALDKGFPVLLQIDTVPSTSQKDEHWILAIGYDGDDLIVQDPWDGATKRITSWGVTAQKLIYAWCWYEGKVPTQVTDPTITIPTKDRDWLVGRATTAKDVASYLAIESPDDAPTESYTKVIAGIKGVATSIQTTLDQTKITLATAEQELINKDEQVGRLKTQLTEQQNYYTAQIDNLNKTYKGIPESLKLAESRIKALLGQVNDAKKAQGKAQNEKAEAQAKLESCQAGKPTPALSFIERIKLLLGFKS